MADDILVANESFTYRYQGADHAFVKGTTRVRSSHPILKDIRHLFTALTPHYEHVAAAPKFTPNALAPKPEVKKPVEEKAATKPEFESATAAPNEKRK